MLGQNIQRQQLSDVSDGALGLDDFQFMRVIGRGSYSKVFAVKQKETKKVYAMKVIKKVLINDEEVLP